MGSMLEHFLSVGVRFEAGEGDRLRALGTLTDELRSAIRENKAAILSELGVRHFRWLLHFADREPIEARFSPIATHAEVLAAYLSRCDRSAAASQAIRPGRFRGARRHRRA